MSVDPWGGGSDHDPKLRREELQNQQRQPPRKWYERGERFYVVLWLIFAAVIVATLIKRGGL